MKIIYTDGKALVVYKGTIIACCKDREEAENKIVRLIIRMGL